MGVNIVENEEAGEDDEPRTTKAPTTRSIRRRAATTLRRSSQEEGNRRPHRRSGAHVPARDGRGRAAQPRGRDRHRQAHRGRPRHDDPGACAKARSPSTRSSTGRTRSTNGEMQLREILDLDAMLSKGPTAEQVEGAEDDDDGEISEETAGPTLQGRRRARGGRRRGRGRGRSMTERRAPRPVEEEEEDNTLSLAQMEETLKPDGAREVRRDHRSLQEIRQAPGRPHRRAGRAATNSPPADEKKYQKLREQLTAEVESVQFHGAKIEYLVDQLYSFNRRLTALGGQMLRLAERHKVPRKRLPRRLCRPRARRELARARSASIDKKWAAFAENEADAVERIRAEIAEIAAGDRHGARRVPPHREHGPEGRARGAHRQEGNGRGQPAPRHLDRQEIHQPRPAVP